MVLEFKSVSLLFGLTYRIAFIFCPFQFILFLPPTPFWLFFDFFSSLSLALFWTLQLTIDFPLASNRNFYCHRSKRSHNSPTRKMPFAFQPLGKACISFLIIWYAKIRHLPQFRWLGTCYTRIFRVTFDSIFSPLPGILVFLALYHGCGLSFPTPKKSSLQILALNSYCTPNMFSSSCWDSTHSQILTARSTQRSKLCFQTKEIVQKKMVRDD